MRFFASSETSKMYSRDVSMSNIFCVDVMYLNLDEFFFFVDVEFIDVMLYFGDVLYILFGWWYRVKVVIVSFSVSYWWD